MPKLNRADLQNLLDIKTKLAATIYIPMHTTGSPPHITENQIRFKNLMHAAADQVRQKDKHSKIITRLEEQIDKYYDNLEFWEKQCPGLLICATANKLEMFHLPIDTEEYVAVDEAFHLAPVMGMLQDAQEFYVLALAQHNPKLHQGTMYGLEASKIELPRSVREALRIDETNRKTENQGTATGPSSHTSGFNGRGGARDPRHEDTLRFFRMVDRAINDKAERSRPLIIAGTEAEAAEYRHLSKYPNLLQGIIPGNHAEADPGKLFETAQSIIRQEIVLPEHRAAIEEYNRLSGANPERVARDAEAIEEAAGQGRVDKLLTRLIRQTTDTVRDQAKEVPRLTFPTGKSGRQLNKAALRVWQSSGRVYNLMADEMPEGRLMAARLRY